MTFLFGAPGEHQFFRSQLLLFLSRPTSLKVATIDFEGDPAFCAGWFSCTDDGTRAGPALPGALSYVNVPVADRDYDYTALAANSDGLIVMNYDQHQTTSSPGPVAAQDWFVNNLRQALKDIPKTKIICSIGNYGYDWALKSKTRHVISVETNNVQEAWLHSGESNSH